MDEAKKSAIQNIVDREIKHFADSYETRFTNEVDDPDGVINSKKNNCFVAATLGSSKNKKIFTEHQDTNYPNFSSWKMEENPSVLQKRIAEKYIKLKDVFDKQERLARLKQEISQLVTELEYFNQYVEESDVNTESIKLKKNLSSKYCMELWQECQFISEEKRQ